MNLVMFKFRDGSERLGKIDVVDGIYRTLSIFPDNDINKTPTGIPTEFIYFYVFSWVDLSVWINEHTKKTSDKTAETKPVKPPGELDDAVITFSDGSHAIGYHHKGKWFIYPQDSLREYCVEIQGDDITSWEYIYDWYRKEGKR